MTIDSKPYFPLTQRITNLMERQQVKRLRAAERLKIAQESTEICARLDLLHQLLNIGAAAPNKLNSSD